MSSDRRSGAPEPGTAWALREVLVVDDEPMVRDFISRVLTRNGYQCRVAGDADEALAAIDSQLPTVVISDVRMPGQGGVWLVEQVKRSRPSLPVIMLTAVADIATAVQCLKAGAADYLSKPIDIDELLIAVRRSAEFVQLTRENREFRDDLESTRAKGEELKNAFHVIETTYKEALGALTNVAPDGSLSRTHADPADASPGAPSAPVTEQSPELLALHAGARLIADAASFVEVAAGVGGELVDGGAARALGVWTPGKAGGGIELLLSAGGELAGTRELALRSLSSGATRLDRDAEVVWAASPVLIGGGIEAILVIGWQSRDDVEAAAATERLALYLATAMKLERDSREKHQIAEELELFQKLAVASRYSLDLHSVAHFLLDSLHRIVDYEVAGLLLLDEHQALHIQTRSTAEPRFIEQVRSHMLNTLKLTCGLEPSGELDVRIRHFPSSAYPSEGRKLRSFVSVPLTVGDRVAGIIHISSGRERAFTTGDTMFLNRAAQFLASSAQGVRDLLAAVKGRIEQMVEHMTDGVLMLDARGDAVAMNRAARLQLRIDDPDYRPSHDELTRMLELDAMELVGSERRSLRRLTCVHGVPYQLQISPVFDNEDFVGAVVSFRNFTEEQKIDEMKSEFISVASHELRTPLTALKNAVAILQGEKLGEVSDGQRRFLGLAQRNVDQLTSIINDLLDLSKIESGKMQIELTPTDAAGPIEAAVSSLAARAEEAEVSLGTQVEQDLPTIYGNAPSLQRIITNLVGNAIKFTPPGGRVDVSAAVHVNETGRSSLRITVTDTGVGIKEDDLETIFEKFHQVEHGPSRGVAGTGLGLPITRELVKAHHGRIYAESDEGEGSRFIVEVPFFTEETYFFRELSQEIERARAQQASVALVLLSATEPERDGRLSGTGEHAERFTTLVESTKNLLHRASDRVIPRADIGLVAVVLPKTDREGASALETRLLDELRSSGLARGNVELTCGSAAHPDDGMTPEELFRAAAASLSGVESLSA